MKKVLLLAVCILFALLIAQGETSGNFKYSIESNGAITITEYTGWADTLEIPETIDGRRVSAIGDYAINSCNPLTQVTIPDSVVSIGEGAFCYCTSLTQISIPDSVVSLGVNPFFNCLSLSSITVSETHPTLCVIDGILYSKADNKLICYPLGLNKSSVSVPFGVTSIGDYAFYYSPSLTQISLPDSVTSIGDNAFELCESLTQISIPDTVTSIGDYAFYSCKSLTQIPIPDSVTSFGYGIFAECSDNLTVTVVQSSEAERFCKENGLKYSAVHALVSTPTPTPIPTPTPAPMLNPFRSVGNNVIVSLVSGSANLYALPDVNSEILAAANRDTALTAFSSNGDWVIVMDSAGSMYYMKASDIALFAPTPTPTPKPYSSAGSNVYAVITADSANLYSLPDPQAPVVSTADQNASFAAVSLNDTWVNVFNTDGVLCFIRLSDVNMVERQPKPAFESEFIDKLKTAYDFEAVEDARMFHESFSFQSDVEKMLYHHYISAWRSIHLEMYKEAQMSLDNLTAIPEASEFYMVLEQYGLIGIDSLKTYVQAMLLPEGFEEIRRHAIENLYHLEYMRASQYMNEGLFETAHTIFDMLAQVQYQDSADMAALCRKQIH